MLTLFYLRLTFATICVCAPFYISALFEIVIEY